MSVRNETVVVGTILFTLYSKMSVHRVFIVEVVPFDNKKNPLLPVITKFSPRDFKVQHPKTIIPFRKFAPARLEEVQRLPVRLFEKNLIPQ